MCKKEEYKFWKRLSSESEEKIAKFVEKKFDHILRSPNSAGAREWNYEFSPEEGKKVFARIYVGSKWSKRRHQYEPRFARLSTIIHTKSGKFMELDLELLQKAVEHFENDIIEMRKEEKEYADKFMEKLKKFFN